MPIGLSRVGVIREKMRESPLDAVHELDKAFNSKNIEGILEFYDENATVVFAPENLITGKTALKKAFSQALALNGKATQLKTKVIESGDIALFISQWVFTRSNPDGSLMRRENYATTVFKKNINGEWLIIIDNSFGPAILGVSSTCKN